jgi:hypothetical protein
MTIGTSNCAKTENLDTRCERRARADVHGRGSPYSFTDPHEPLRDKEGILCRLDRVRGVVEMTARLLIWDGGDFADYGAALELAHAELQRIREEVDVAMSVNPCRCETVEASVR